MYPILFSLGSFEIRSHDALIALGALLAFALFVREARPLGVTRRDVWISLPLVVVLTFAGVYLSAVWIRSLGYGWADPATNLRYGTASFGMVLGVLLAGYLAARWRGRPAGAVLDRLALVLPLAQALGRVGCFLEGCCYGLVTDGPLGMVLPGAGGQWAARYPTQLLLAAFDLGLFALLWSRRGKGKFAGSQTVLYLLCFSLGRVLIDGLRDLPRVWGPFSPHQLTALAMLLITIYFTLELRFARSRP
jgi:phosphatidylglycerol---prolipoprotein diacylglyceryl transferase